MASVTPTPSITYYSSPCSLSTRFVRVTDLFDLQTPEQLAACLPEAAIPEVGLEGRFVAIYYVTDRNLPLRSHRSPLSAAARYGLLPQLRRSAQQCIIGDSVATIIGPAAALQRLSKKIDSIFEEFLLYDCPTMSPRERPWADGMCILEPNIFRITDGIIGKGDFLSYQESSSAPVVETNLTHITVIMTKGEDALVSMPREADFGIGCHHLATTINSVCDALLRSFRWRLSRRQVLLSIENIYLYRQVIGFHLKRDDSYLLRQLEPSNHAITIGITRNKGSGDHPWTAILILSKTMFPFIGAGADAKVTLAIKINEAKPELFASLACRGHYRFTRQAILLHQEFEPYGAVPVEAHFPPYEKKGKGSSVKTVTRILQKLCEGNLAQCVNKIVREKGSLIPLSQTLGYIHDILIFFEAFHKAGWAHRDMKPTNVLYTTEIGEDGKIRQKVFVSDLIRACHKEQTGDLEELNTTTEYIDPSCANTFCATNGSRDTALYSFIDFQAADIWAIGMTLLALLQNRYENLIPTVSDEEWGDYIRGYPGLTPDAEKQDDMRKAYSIFINSKPKNWASQLLKERGFTLTAKEAAFIDGLLDPDPKTRFTAEHALAYVKELLSLTSVPVAAPAESVTTSLSTAPSLLGAGEEAVEAAALTLSDAPPEDKGAEADLTALVEGVDRSPQAARAGCGASPPNSSEAEKPPRILRASGAAEEYARKATLRPRRPGLLPVHGDAAQLPTPLADVVTVPGSVEGLTISAESTVTLASQAQRRAAARKVEGGDEGVVVITDE